MRRTGELTTRVRSILFIGNRNIKDEVVLATVPWELDM